MGDIKSAWEKALEKAEQLGKPSDEELKRLEHIPTGNAIAAKYLSDEKFDLDSEITKYKGTGNRQYIVWGIQETFLRNISLPHDERDKYLFNRSLSGLRLIKENRKQVDIVIDHVKNIISYYEQARQHTFTQFKKDFETRVKEAGKMVQQMHQQGASLEAQLQQQFQEEWRTVIKDIDVQYEKALEDQKQQLIKIA
jgi:hypothetical protein